MIRKSGKRFSLATNAKRLRGDHAQARSDNGTTTGRGISMGALSRRAAKLAALSILAMNFLPATPAFAEASTINAADTAWMIVATALVLMMTIPGLALFYSGMVRK